MASCAHEGKVWDWYYQSWVCTRCEAYFTAPPPPPEQRGRPR